MDRQAVVDLIEDDWSAEDWRITGLKGFDELDEFQLYLVKNRESTIGCCAIKINENKSAQLAVYLFEEFRSRGLGRDLITRIHNIVRAMGATYAFSPVQNDNMIMQKLLDSFGHETYPSMEAGYVIRGLEL